MSVCFFIGHHDCPRSVEKKLKDTIIKLITECSVDTFYVGNHGNFDNMTTDILFHLKKSYNITFNIVLAYMPDKHQHYKNTILPDGIETVPKKFAISYRNKWMISQSDYLICYVINNIGNSSKYLKISEKTGIQCFNIAK